MAVGTRRSLPRNPWAGTLSLSRLTVAALVPLALLVTAGREQPRPLSVGSPTDGHLVAGTELRAGPGLKVKATEARYGLPELVSLLEDGSGAVNDVDPAARVVVGDLSLEEGGPLPPHASHRSGRDADVGFLMADQNGKAAHLPHFHPVDGEGTSLYNRRFHFDRKANWALVADWLTSRAARVQKIFVSAEVKEMLLRTAAAEGAPRGLMRKARRVLRPHKAHNNHFHVRIACPRRMRRVCVNHPR